MSADYRPGTVAEIGWNTTSGRERAIFDGDRWGTESGSTVHKDNAIEVRPLVVLDMPATVVPARLAEALRGDGFSWIAEQIEEQIRPPKPEEPTGLGAVAEDANGGKWVRIRDGYWLSECGLCLWTNLDAVRVLSEGVAP